MPELAHRPTPPGICATCNAATSCMHLRRQPLAVWHCRDFDDRPTRAADAFAEPTTSVARAAFRGLCDDCANRAACALPARSEGVWICEEYR